MFVFIVSKVVSSAFIFVAQVYRNTPETVNLIIEVFVEVAHKQICYLGEVSSNCTSAICPAGESVMIY